MTAARTPARAGLDGLPPALRDRVVAFRLVLVLGVQLRALMDRRFAGAGVTTQQAALLTVAGARATPPTQGELADALGVSHQNVRQLMTALERKGLLEVVADPADRRIRRARPTAAVRRLFRRRDRGDFEAVAGWFAALDDREVARLVDMLERVARTTMGQRARAAQPATRRGSRRASAAASRSTARA